MKDKELIRTVVEPKGVGRPTKLTPERQALIIDALEGGNYQETAANLAGINIATLENWRRKGRAAKSGRYYEFERAVVIALAQAEKYLVGIVERAAVKDWKAASWLLERKHMRRWGHPGSLLEGGKAVIVINYPSKEDTEPLTLNESSGSSSRRVEVHVEHPSSDPGD